ncbi:hypothetical protein [Streptomyces sp. cmx-4-9]|uniref:hypothetical protein n=1 Tax=Streptomyces sp. cmx-4-9 TaxID=2790941 RepID=UPI00397F4C11
METTRNCSHAKFRCVGGLAMAVLKAWRILRKRRGGTNLITGIVMTILVLHHIST